MFNKFKQFLGLRFPRIYGILKRIYRFFFKMPNNAPVISLPQPIVVRDTPADIASRKQIQDGLVEWSGRVNKVLIIGRIKEGDSIASKTNAFLWSVDFDAYDVFLYDEYTHNLYLYKDRATMQYVKTCFAPELDPSFFDILIYANILDNCEAEYPFKYRVPAKAPFLSFAYPIFDGTEPPKEWVSILNLYFDGVIVACGNLKKIFESAGVVKPIFELPIALDLNPYIKKREMPHKRDEYVFGWIGTFEDRKNPFKIITAFEEAFGDKENVKLMMHTRFIDKTTEVGKRFDSIRAGLPSNIIITEGVRSDDEIVSLMNSFDTYVYVSQGEGYSITPRQAMACGLSVILSAIPTQLDITNLGENDGVYWVPANIEIDAVQPSLNNRVCGKMYDIETADLVKVFRQVYAQKNEINSEASIVRRIKDSERYDISNMSFQFRQLILPNAVRFAEDNKICEDAIETTDYDLFVKYKHYLRNEKRNVVVCPAHDGGFCSVFNKWMSHLVYSRENTILIPDWRVKRLKASVLNQFGRRGFDSFCYGKDSDGNLFFRCFENPYEGLISDEILESNLMYEVADEILSEFNFNEKNEPNLTYINSYNLYDDADYFPVFRRKYNHYYRKYVKLIPALQRKIDEFTEQNLKGKFVISAHIRSAAQQSELIEGDKPTWDLYEKHIREILKKEKIEETSDAWRLFIASDNSQSIAYFKGLFGNHVVAQPMNRLDEKDDQEYQKAAEKAGKNIEGFGLQHRAAKDEAKWSLQNAYDILFDVSVLAKGDYYIFVNSNISTMVSYVNPETKMIYCR